METVSALLIEPVISALLGNLIPKLIPEQIFPAKLAEMEKWKTILEDFHGVLEDAENKKEKDPVLRCWLRGLVEIIYDVEDLTELLCYDVLQNQVESSLETVNKMVKWQKRTWKTIKLTRKFDKITEKLQSLEGRKKKLELMRLPGRTSSSTREGSSRWPSTSLATNDRVVFGREDDKRALMEALLSGKKGNDSFEVILIVGMGGLGKTTLARCVYNDNQITSCFDIRAWVCVSSSFDIYRITANILIEAFPDCNTKGQSLDAVQKQLSMRLTNKRFLIVLDDLWNEKPNDWAALQPPFFSGKVGSRIIVTTRSMSVANCVGTMDPVSPRKLSDEDCYALLCEHAKLDPEETSVYEEIGKKIAKKCFGLPLAAMNVGGLLRHTNRVKWVEILNSKSWTSGNEKLVVMSILKKSYSELSLQLKRCLAFFGMLPEDYQFNELEIVLMWIGVGVVQLIDDQKSKREIGHDCFDQLRSWSFFSPIESGYKQRYVMHDLIRQLAMEVSPEGHYIGKTDEIPKPFQNLRHIVCHYSIVEEVIGLIKRKGPLRVFMSFPIRGIANRFEFGDMLRHLKYLRALRHSTLGDKKGLLTESFGQLKLLKYLDLSYSDFERLPDSVTSLYMLEILIMHRCTSLLMLPEKIGNLMNLSHLDMSWCKKLKKLPDRIGELRKLDYLSVENCEELQELPAGIENLGNLSDLDVGWCKKLKEPPAGIVKLGKLSYLSVKSCKNMKKLPVGIEKLENLRFLDISLCSECEELPTEIGNFAKFASS